MQRRFQVIRGSHTIQPDREKQDARKLPDFEEVLTTHLDSLLGVAMRLMAGQRGPAEDLVQEASLRAFRNYRSLRSPERVKPWFFRILINTYINEFQRESRRPRTVDIELREDLLDSANLGPVLTPEDQIFERLLDSEIQQALDALPTEFSTVVWLSDVEDLSYREISEILNCPTGTVASRLYRGHAQLREFLREYARRRRLMKE